MPMSARMPMEKIRMPIMASSSITPAWERARRMASSAEPWVGVVGDRRVAHANLAAGGDRDAQAAHRLVAGRGLARAAARVADVDLGDGGGRGRGLHHP